MKNSAGNSDPSHKAEPESGPQPHRSNRPRQHIARFASHSSAAASHCFAPRSAHCRAQTHHPPHQSAVAPPTSRSPSAHSTVYPRVRETQAPSRYTHPSETRWPRLTHSTLSPHPPTPRPQSKCFPYPRQDSAHNQVFSQQSPAPHRSLRQSRSNHTSPTHHPASTPHPALRAQESRSSEPIHHKHHSAAPDHSVPACDSRQLSQAREV